MVALKRPRVELENSNVSKILIKCVIENDLELLDYFISNGEDINTRNPTNHNYPLLMFTKKMETVKWLIEHGADPNLTGDNGFTYLHKHCFDSNYKVIKYLIENGADPNLKTPNGNTALSRSVKRESLKIVKLMLTKDNINANLHGFSLVKIAIQNKKTKCLAYLIEQGAVIDRKDILKIVKNSN